MTSSYRSVNYSIRPAKAVERKILCELFRRFEPFGRISTYRYVGLGSIYFTDFQLFHQMLAISDMISIEKEETSWPRFKFNLPFRCVELLLGHSNEILPQIPWDKRSLAWMDYDGKLDKGVLADIATFFSRAVSGSAFFVSINVEPERVPGGSATTLDELRLKNFTEAIGEEKVPLGLTGANLRPANLPAVCRHVIDSEIQLQLNARNGPLPDDRKLVYQQLINLLYADDAQMLTVGGLLYEKQHQSSFEACAFDELSFVKRAEEPLHVNAPKLTQKEIRFLNAQLPQQAADKIALPGVPPTDVTEYAKIYRYYPSFSEVIHG